MGRSYFHRSYDLQFDNREQMIRFILLYRDLFVPYSKDYIRCATYVRDTPCYRTKGGNLYSRGHHDKNIENMLRCGYRIYNNNNLTINILASEFKEIVKVLNFKKVTKNHRSTYIYTEQRVL